MLIVWHAGGLAAIDAETGTVIWEELFRTRMETPIATPVWRSPHLLVSAFFNGSRLFRVGGASADLLWKGASDSGVDTDGLHALMNSPVIVGDYIYGICSYGQLRCLRLATGERVWETQAVTREKARNASAFMVRNGDRYFINNDRGELIIARLAPTGYSEISRAFLIRPTSAAGGRRELGAGELVPSGVRRQERFCAERRRDRVRVTGCRVSPADRVPSPIRGGNWSGMNQLERPGTAAGIRLELSIIEEVRLWPLCAPPHGWRG